MEKYKLKGFSLIELLVVIVIMGILATISIGTFTGFFKKARGGVKVENVNTMAHLVKITEAANRDGGKYSFTDAADLKAKVFTPNDFPVPNDADGLCYWYYYDKNGAGFSDNEFAVASWDDNANNGAGGIIVDGTLNFSTQISAVTRASFLCTGGTGGTFTETLNVSAKFKIQ